MADCSAKEMADRYRWVTVLSEDGIRVQPTEERKARLLETRRHSVTETDEMI